MLGELSSYSLLNALHSLVSFSIVRNSLVKRLLSLFSDTSKKNDNGRTMVIDKAIHPWEDGPPL